MCGIVGILGREPVAVEMVEALKRLEYRGYDSAGVATLEGGHLTRRRAEGKLKNLEKRLTKEPLGGHSGIGHTRWATHGRPNEVNAHPHATDKVAVVHNGTEAWAGSTPKLISIPVSPRCSLRNTLPITGIGMRGCLTP